MNNETSLLISEPPLQVLPTLAKAIGLNEAIVTQQLHYLLRDKRNGRVFDGHQWIFNTYEQWQERFFPFWSIPTIQRIFSHLEKAGVFVACQPEGRLSRRKYYRLSGAAVSNLTVERAQKAFASKAPIFPSYQIDTFDDPNLISSYYIEDSTKNTKKKEKGYSVEKRWVNPKYDYPLTLESMHQALEILGVEVNEDYDGNFFDQMTKAGWKIQGREIWDWVKVYKSRLLKTVPGNN